MAVIDILMKRRELAEPRRRAPRITQLQDPATRRDASTLSRALAAAYNPSGRYAELLRTLRSQLLMRGLDSQASMLAIVSARAGDGCSTLAGNLAIVFAQLGERTLLVDANLRAPAQHTLFGIQDEPGLVEVLNGRASATDALHNIMHFESLWVLPAGATPPNPQELIGRLAFTELLQELGAQFNAIIVDTPPLLECAEAQIVAARTGACLFNARGHHTPIEDLERARAQLASVTNVLGAVISD